MDIYNLSFRLKKLPPITRITTRHATSPGKVYILKLKITSMEKEEIIQSCPECGNLINSVSCSKHSLCENCGYKCEC